MRPVVLDSNILISAFLYAGKPKAIFELGINQEIDIAISPAIMAETERVLRDKFGLSEDRLEIVHNAMTTFAIQVTPTEVPRVVPDDPDDDKIVACAVAAGAQAIITGDKHLLKMGTHEGIPIVTAAEFLRGRDRAR